MRCHKRMSLVLMAFVIGGTAGAAVKGTAQEIVARWGGARRAMAPLAWRRQ